LRDLAKQWQPVETSIKLYKAVTTFQSCKRLQAKSSFNT
jgi:hypothetical protein